MEIYNVGVCHWEPRFELSVSQCRIDVTWFPFDEQTCELVFESWMLPESILKLRMYDEPVYMGSFLKPDGWSVLGMCWHYEILRLSVITDSILSYDDWRIPPFFSDRQPDL